MAAVPVTCPYEPEPSCVFTDEYCTVLNRLFAVARISKERVSPNEIVFASDPLTEIVPGPGIE